MLLLLNWVADGWWRCSGNLFHWSLKRIVTFIIQRKDKIMIFRRNFEAGNSKAEADVSWQYTWKPEVGEGMSNIISSIEIFFFCLKKARCRSQAFQCSLFLYCYFQAIDCFWPNNVFDSWQKWRFSEIEYMRSRKSELRSNSVLSYICATLYSTHEGKLRSGRLHYE